MIGGLHPVRVPTLGEEALRDLVRARQDVGGELMRARHRLSKLLLRHDVRCGGARVAWTQRHRQWLTGVDLAAQAALLDYIGAIDAVLVRRDTLEATIAELVPDSPWAETVARRPRAGRCSQPRTPAWRRLRAPRRRERPSPGPRVVLSSEPLSDDHLD